MCSYFILFFRVEDEQRKLKGDEAASDDDELSANEMESA
jgi:hypothetical protein